MDRTGTPVTFRNGFPLFLWGIVGFFLGGCVLMTYCGLTGRVPGGETTWKFWAVVALFWTIGLIAGFVSFKIPITVLKITPLRADYIQYWQWGRRIASFNHTDIADFRLIKTTDSDGDPYFKAIMTTRSGHEYVIKEGHTQEAIESIIARCRSALSNR